MTWEYRDDAWAKVNCSIIDDFVTVRDIAERVVFKPTSLRVPLRLTWVPDGFRVTGASDRDFDGGVAGGWSMGQRRAADGFALHVDSWPASKHDLRPGQPGTTTDVIAGYPAVLQAEWHTIQLDAGAYRIVLTADGYQSGQTEWAAGRRELLVRLAESLVPAAISAIAHRFDARAARRTVPARTSWALSHRVGRVRRSEGYPRRRTSRPRRRGHVTVGQDANGFDMAC